MMYINRNEGHKIRNYLSLENVNKAKIIALLIKSMEEKTGQF